MIGDFGTISELRRVFPISIYQLGFVFGALLFGPLSEAYGRRLVIIGPFIALIISTVGCALTYNWNSFLAFRWMCGVSASSAIPVTAGLCADLFDDPVKRGRANALSLAVSVLPVRTAMNLKSQQIFRLSQLDRNLGLLYLVLHLLSAGD